MKFEKLRKSAEAKLNSVTTDFDDLETNDRHLLIHELRTHQIELELQNEELQKTQSALVRSRDRFCNLYNSTPVGLLTLDKAGFILEANTTLAKILGTSKSELIMQALSDYVCHEFQDALYHFYRLIQTSKQPQAIELQMRSHHGELLWIKIECNVILDSNNHISQIQASLINITNSKHILEELSAQKNLFQLILQTTKDMIILKDKHHVYQHANPAFCQFLGKSEADIVGKTDYDLFDEVKAYQFQQNDILVMSTGETSIRDEQITSFTGDKWLHVVNSPIVENKQMTGVLCSIRDISKRKYYEHSIWRQANFDPLTNLPNRSLFMDRCEQAIHYAHRENTRMALLFIDLDRFKWINDTLGHEAGDKVLQETARRLSSCSRESDTVARLSGDEFTIILSDITDLNSVRIFAEKILKKMSQPYLLQDSEDCYISGSIGVTLYPDDGINLRTILRNADRAMYRAKERGRNAIEFFTHQLNESAYQRMNLVHELRHADHEKEFTVLYQPIHDLKSGGIFGTEALLRWQHPGRGLLLPENFLITAEETGAIIPIGKWVLNHVTRQIISWKNQDLHLFHVAINVSARQFRNKNFATELNDILTKNFLPDDILNLDLEITESLMLNHAKENIDMLNSIKKLNVSLSLDDFGTGYSSLQQLKYFPIDTLKIDRSFVRNILTSSKDARLTRSMISMAHDLGMLVIAEGIESQSQLDFLQSAGADYGQGYYFSRPLSEINFTQYYQSCQSD